MNSIYERFGMSRHLTSHAVIKQSKVDEFLNKIGLDNMLTKLDLGNKTIISYSSLFPKTPKINMSIAAAIAANSRIVMSQFKNNSEYKLYYSDTDSIFIDRPLSSEQVDNKKLGLMKLEHVLTKLIALAPKVYGGLDTNGTEFTKTKGIKIPVSLEQLESLLVQGNNLVLRQEKWFNNVEDASIAIKNTSYDLKPTSNKRELVYSQGILVGTGNKSIES